MRLAMERASSQKTAPGARICDLEVKNRHGRYTAHGQSLCAARALAALALVHCRLNPNGSCERLKSQASSEHATVRSCDGIVEARIPNCCTEARKYGCSELLVQPRSGPGDENWGLESRERLKTCSWVQDGRADSGAPRTPPQRTPLLPSASTIPKKLVVRRLLLYSVRSSPSQIKASTINIRLLSGDSCCAEVFNAASSRNRTHLLSALD